MGICPCQYVLGCVAFKRCFVAQTARFRGSVKGGVSGRVNDEQDAEQGLREGFLVEICC